MGPKKTSKKLQNRQKLTVSCAVTMVTVIIFLIFDFDLNSFWRDSHFGVLNDYIWASSVAWDPKNTQKQVKSSKIDSFLHGYHGYGKYFLFFILILIVLDQTVILVYYMTMYLLPLMHVSTKTLRKGKNRRKCDVSCMVTMVTMVTENIFHFFLLILIVIY